MSPKLVECQGQVVNAFMDSLAPGLSWRKAFIHAEFGAEDALAQSLTEAFLVLARPDPARPHSLPLESAVMQALEHLHRDYRAAGHGFHQLDLILDAPDGRYRFEFSHTPSLRLSGQRDPDARPRLARRYAALLAELGLPAR
ncbi:hypothetical protein SAMN02745121_07515 [Nannocystis exedens]|uniref:Uncharacterized protein n=1 Tax=Nannocystis exedens TaxID=54 RepID=A0A1I2GUX0_9BACT|nr:hypothetical protein [Nannocystis exedens]PCC74086.1 hypothetical protein NAEX_07175 [Nannocystis exedens]SFF20940.1 hypothetical protein SAMN02745121_07515 [Nannocystis exedens]